ncbi:MAG: GNAT family N-acetyltransferase, partial [Gemmatimonadetes bacterium]|nr:GNAT family N-acetyltransferase [Gemmatimonadota bacterium]NIU30652.1 GNAT family N-acetyltransferase [Gemmatimonadota bacterium]NIV61009.1 GNAT family N-acetyltransferase [Gemmatimonadota bacterium]NIW63707.1 GNAT family N-acetyltransferase [Gemmatimonadota bacterium]NIY12187.1 GNAT family N-acetyltransferase [Gemmatimonadota bacterium]
MIWARLRTALWPEAPADHPREIAAYFSDPPPDAACLLAEDDEGRIVGFAEVGMRRCAEGCESSPVAYLEGIYVDPP